MIIQKRHGIQAVGVGYPTGTAGCQAGELPAEVMAFSKLVLFSNEQAQKCAAYISEAGECEIAGRNEELLRDKFSLVEIN